MPEDELEQALARDDAARERGNRPAPAVALKYKGLAAGYIYGVPAKDLAPEETAQLSTAQYEHALASGLYEPAEAPSAKRPQVASEPGAEPKATPAGSVPQVPAAGAAEGSS